jgi:hypothetical protein
MLEQLAPNVVFGEHHLQRLLHDYVAYYHDHRTHLGLGKHTPTRRQPSTQTRDDVALVAHARLGGLHHRPKRLRKSPRAPYFSGFRRPDEY